MDDGNRQKQQSVSADEVAVALGRLDQALQPDGVREAWLTVSLIEEALGSAARDGHHIAPVDFLAWLEDGKGLGRGLATWEGFRVARDAYRGANSCRNLDCGIPAPEDLYEIADRMLLGDDEGSFFHERYQGRMDNWQEVAAGILAEGRGLAAAGRLFKAFHELQPVGPRVSFQLARALVPLFLQLCLGLTYRGPWISQDLDVGGLRRTDIGLTGARQRSVDGYQEIDVIGTDTYWSGFFAAAVMKAAQRGMARARRAAGLTARIEERVRPGRAGGLLDRVRPMLTTVPVFAKRDVARWTETSDHTAEKLCRDLLATGLVEEITGRKRYRLYWIPDLWW